MIKTKEEVTELIKKARNGDDGAFRELERVAKPLLVSLSRKFANYDHFEYDDLYSIALNGLYKACVSYNERNPSFLDYAKVIIMRDFWREMKYWNAKKRSSYEMTEVPFDSIAEISNLDIADDEIESSMIRSDFRDNVLVIIDECFDAKKGEMLRRYILEGHRIIDIAKDMDVKYKNVYSVVQRGLHKITHEYRKRHDL